MYTLLWITFLKNNIVDQNLAEFLFNSNLKLTQDEILAAIANTIFQCTMPSECKIK